MNVVLARWNTASTVDAAGEILPCCGSRTWARELAARRPFASETELLAASDAIWFSLSEDDWQEAFDSHPRIGERHAQRGTTAQSVAWSEREQAAATTSEDTIRSALREANRLYEESFGHIFLICAAGRSSEEILANLRERMNNDTITELHEAAEQQRQITHLRLRRWMEET